MAINTEVLEQALNLAEGTLEQAIKSENIVDLDLSKVKIFKSEDYETLKSNHEKALQEKQVYSNQVGKEEALKLFVRELLPEGFEGRKDEQKVITALKEQIALGKGGDKNQDLEELKNKLELHQKALLDKDSLIEEEKQRYLSLEGQIKKEKDSMIFNSAIETEFNKYKDTSKYDKADIIDLYKVKTGFEIKEGNLFLKKGDELINDEIGNPHTLENHFKEFMSTRVKMPEGGNGDKNYQFTKKMNPSDWMKSYKNQNPTSTQQEMTRALSQAISQDVVDSTL